MTNGTLKTIKNSIDVTPANGDVIKITFSSSNISVYINGAEKINVSDNSIRGTKHGIGTWCSGSLRIDSFSVSNTID